METGAAISIAPKGFASHIKLSPAPSTLQLANINRQSSQNLWPEACPSSEPRSELAS